MSYTQIVAPTAPENAPSSDPPMVVDTPATPATPAGAAPQDIPPPINTEPTVVHSEATLTRAVETANAASVEVSFLSFVFGGFFPFSIPVVPLRGS